MDQLSKGGAATALVQMRRTSRHEFSKVLGKLGKLWSAAKGVWGYFEKGKLAKVGGAWY